MSQIKTYSVASGWQYRVMLANRIVGGWAPTPEAAKRKATEVASR